jgi:carbonic anhydrase/acetyltransferase-like protein (isoleucine patch superfamily)
MSPPSPWLRFRQAAGRALRETGQALDRLGVQASMLATTVHDYYDDPVVYQDHLSRHRQLLPLLWSGRPHVDPGAAYVAPCATLVGSVRVRAGASVWYGAVLRADEVANALDDDVPELDRDRFEDRPHHHGGCIVIGEGTNVQDGAIVTARVGHCRVGRGVTVGHLAQIHSATVGDHCLVGMGSVVLEGAVIESEAFVGAGAVIGPSQVVGSGELWVGNPARRLRDLTPEERRRLHKQSSDYVQVASSQKGVMLLGGNLSPSMLLQQEDEADGESTGSALPAGADSAAPAEEAAEIDDAATRSTSRIHESTLIQPAPVLHGRSIS